MFYLDSPPDPSTVLRDLRGEVRRIERRHVSHSRGVMPVGVAEIDAALPGGGLAQGALHEAMGGETDTDYATAATLFMAGLLARTTGPILWVLHRPDLFAPGLACAGLSPGRIIFAEAGKDVLGCMEEGLQHPALAAVVGEVMGRLPMVASRRLQLAAEHSGVLALALRRTWRQEDTAALREPTAAVTRWRVTPLPSPPVAASRGLGRARWRVDLLRCKGGAQGAWVVEACDAGGRVSVVRPARRVAAVAWNGGLGPPGREPMPDVRSLMGV